MAAVGFSQAAALAGVSRQHLYKMADAGQISVIKELLPGRTGDNPKDYRQVIDVSELQRVFGQLKTVSDFADKPSAQEAVVMTLELELRAAQQMLRERDEQLRKAEEREEWLKKQVRETQSVIKLLGYSKQPDQDFVSKEKYEKTVAKAAAIIKGLRRRLQEKEPRGFQAWFFGR